MITNFRSLIFNGERFVVLGAQYLATSEDGLIWTEQALPIRKELREYFTLYGANGTTFLLGSGFYRLANGEWEDLGDKDFFSMASGGGKLVAVDDYNNIWIHEQGMHWNRVIGDDLPYVEAGVKPTIIHDGTRFILDSRGSRGLYTSRDAITWNRLSSYKAPQTLPPLKGATLSKDLLSPPPPRIQFHNGHYFRNNGYSTSVSTDLVLWQPIAENLGRIVGERGNYLATGFDPSPGTLYVSEDAINWTSYEKEGSLAVAYHDGRFVCVGSEGVASSVDRLMASRDGRTWQAWDRTFKDRVLGLWSW